jgi:mannitol/fructose-specific phosphotransferase system IIA component (Ntr-type)
LDAAVVGVGVAKQGVSEPSTGKSVRIVFLLLTPMAPPEVHVRLLSRISKLAQHSLLRQELADAPNAEDAARVLEEHMTAFERQAAVPAERKVG